MKVFLLEFEAGVLPPQVLLDYEVDSDDEWEEEEPGESLSHSEGVRVLWPPGRLIWRRSPLALVRYETSFGGVIQQYGLSAHMNQMLKLYSCAEGIQ